MRGRWILLLMLMAPALTTAQTPVDKTRRIIGGRVIMESDISAALALRLVSASATTSEDVEVALENRLLKLQEIGTTSLAAPTDEDVADYRKRWETRLGAGASLAERLARLHMSDAELTAWLREDARIEKYERSRFGRDQNPDAAVARWVQDLRRRAGLK